MDADVANIHFRWAYSDWNAYRIAFGHALTKVYRGYLVKPLHTISWVRVRFFSAICANGIGLKVCPFCAQTDHA